MAEGGSEIVPIGLALDTAPLLRGTQQATAALQAIDASTRQAAASLKALATQSQANARVSAEQVAAYSRTRDEALAYRKEQDALALTLRQTQVAQRQANAELKLAVYTKAKDDALAYKQSQDQLKESLRQQREAQAAANAEASKAGAIWQQALGVAGGIGIATSIGAITTALIAQGKSVVDTGVKFEQLRRSLAAISGSPNLGRQEFAFVTDTANRLGLGIEGLATSYRGLTAATRGTELAGQDTQALFTALSAASRTYGMSTEQTGRALNAFQQIVSKGKVSQEELRQQLAEAIPGASQITARAFGVTTQELDKMIEKGMSATEFFRRFTPQLAKETPAATAMAGQGFTQLGNEIVLMKDRLAQAGVLKFFEDLAAQGAKALAASRTAAVDTQSAALRSATRALGGEDPLKLSPANQRRLLEVSGREAATEAEMRARQVVLPAEAPLLGMLQRRLALVRQEQADLAKVIQLQEQAVKNAAKLLTEPGTQFDAQERARKQQDAEQKERDQDRFKEIDVRTNKQAEAAEKAEKLQERLATIEEDFQRKKTQLDPTGKTPLEVLTEQLTLAEQRTKALDDALGKLGRTTSGSGGASPWRHLIEPLAVARGVDPRLVEALVTQESGNDPRAVSRAGAKGLGQFMPGTAAQYGIAGREFEPAANLRATVAYLADLLKMFSGDVSKALTAYNAGPGRGGIPLATGENATFARDVLRRMPGGGSGAGMSPLLATAQAEESALRLQATAAKEGVQASEAVVQMRMKEHQASEQAIEQLTRMAARYTQTTEARVVDTAAALVAKTTTDEATYAEAKRLEGLIKTGVALEANTKAENAHAVAVEAAVKAALEKEDAALQRMRDQSEQLTQELADTNDPAGRSHRADVRALQLMRRISISPEKMAEAKAIQAKDKELRDLIDRSNKITSISDDLAGRTLDIIERLSQGSITSFGSFMQSVAQSVQQILNQQYLQPYLSGLIKGAIKGIGDAITPTAGGGAGAANVDAATYAPGNFSGLASGGAAYSNTPYVVGERGAEAFVPAQDGRILSHADSMAAVGGKGMASQRPISVTVNVHGVTSAESFVRSRAQVQAAMLQALQQASRAA